MAAMNRQQGVFVFEADTAAFANRKRAARACASCQKRKKRCPHTFTRSQDGANGTGGDGAEKVLPNLTHKEPIRFVGDLNPESILTDLSYATNERNFSRIGTWVEQSRLIQQEQLRREEEAAAQSNSADKGSSAAQAREAQSAKHADAIKALSVERYSKVERGRRTLTGHQRNYLQAVGAFRVLPKDTSDALIKLYLTHIDPVLPVVDGKKLQQDYAAGDASIWLIQAICLVACKTDKALPYLRLYEEGPLLEPIPFARNLHTGLDAAMKADLEADRFQKIQIMTLMSLHNDGPGGIEESSAHLIQAIHDAQTTGVHICTPGRTRNDQGAMLWWTLWMLDKFNACLGGRPLMINERDIDISKPSPEPTPRSQAMSAWLEVGKLLNEVIEYYRPMADPDVTGWEHEFPSFTTLTAGCNLHLVEPAHRNLLEICYNIIGILACRNGGPSTTSYMRRIACSDRIQALVTDSNNKLLPPIPLLPYAVSLSLTVAYRGLRDHYSDPAKAFADLTARCDILEGFSKTWWTADAMTKLGKKALKSLQNPTPSVQDLTRKDSSEPPEVGDIMEVEVAPCKFGPFTEPKAKPEITISKPPKIIPNKATIPDLRTPTLQQQPQQQQQQPQQLQPQPQQLHKKQLQQQPQKKTNGIGTGNALQLLSDAAATHGLPSESKGRRPTLLGVYDADPERKRRRFGVSPLPFTSQPSIASFPSALAHSNALLPTGTALLTNTAQHLSAHSASTPSFHDPTPTSSNTPATSLLATDPNTDHLQDTFMTFNPDYNDPSAFSDLDNLFDGFFDLSLPTMFQDPLFEGAAYLNVDDFNIMDGMYDYTRKQNMFMPGLPSGLSGTMGMGGMVPGTTNGNGTGTGSGNTNGNVNGNGNGWVGR